jgi:hypothetical protein
MLSSAQPPIERDVHDAALAGELAAAGNILAPHDANAVGHDIPEKLAINDGRIVPVAEGFD